MTGSLFGEEPVAKQTEHTAPQRVELMTEGSYLDDGARVSISYKESAQSGLEGSRATVSFCKNAPEQILMLRTGSVKTRLVFEEGMRHHCVYQTPMMPFDVCVHTAKVCNALEKEGTLLLEYVVELRGAEPEHTKMTLKLLPAYDTPQGI